MRVTKLPEDTTKRCCKCGTQAVYAVELGWCGWMFCRPCYQKWEAHHKDAPPIDADSDSVADAVSDAVEQALMDGGDIEDAIDTAFMEATQRSDEDDNAGGLSDE